MLGGFSLLDLLSPVIKAAFSREHQQTDYKKNLSIDNFPFPKRGGEDERYITSWERKSLTIENGVYYIKGTALGSSKGVHQNVNQRRYDPSTYITFGAMMAYIQKYSGETDGKDNPTLYFNFDYENLGEDKNYINTFAGNFSSDPTICLIPYKSIDRNISRKLGNTLDINTKINIELLKNNKFHYSDGLGRLANIYVDLNFIAEQLKLTRNEDDEVIYVDFLKNILKGISEALGGLNKFRVIDNEDTGLMEIVIENPLNIDPSTQTSDRSVINTFGVLPDGGSFVKEMSLNAELTDDYAAMTSIGAQGDGNQRSSNSTTFTMYNKGLEDRIIPQKLTEEEDKEMKIYTNIDNSKIGTAISTNPSLNPSSPFTGTYNATLPITSELNAAQLPLQTFTEESSITEDIGIGTVDAHKDFENRQKKKEGGHQWQKRFDELFNENFKETFNSIYGELIFTDDMISSLKEMNSQFVSLATGKLTQEGKYPPPFFLPFNLSLTLDGLSGMRLFQNFEMDNKVLPPTYDKTRIELNILSLSHQVTPESWVTKIETYSVPVFNEVYVADIPGGRRADSKECIEIDHSDLITPNLSYEAIIRTDHTTWCNHPNQMQLDNIKAASLAIFEPVYEQFNGNIKINSIFRSEEVNLAVGGSDNSQHKANSGAAFDVDGINGVTNKQIFDYIKDNLEFDQLIWEFGAIANPEWVHFSYKAIGNRKKLTRAYSHLGETVYSPYVSSEAQGPAQGQPLGPSPQSE